MSGPFAEDQVYRVRSEEDPTAVLALDVQVRGGYLSWFDTHRDRGHRIALLDAVAGKPRLRTDTGFTYVFEPLTKEIYDTEVKPFVELPPEFETTEALRRFYLNTFLGKGD